MWLWIWLVIAVAAAIGETLTYDLFLASVAAAAVVVGFGALILPWPIQLAGFAVLALLGIFVVRPAAKAALGLNGAEIPRLSGTHKAVIGRKAIVTSTVTDDSGQIRIGEGEFWTARSFDPDETIQAGRKVRVLLVQGVTALVEPVIPLDTDADDSSEEMLSEKGL